jgi:hypothetical protein
MQATDSGFAITERVFEPTELRGVVTLFEHELATRSRAGARHLLGIPLVRDLANDEPGIELAVA